MSSSQQGGARTPVNDDALAFQDYVRAGKRQAPVVVVITLLALLAAFLVVSLQTEMYRAQTLLVFTGEGLTTDPDRAETLTALFDSEAIALGVITRLGLDTTPKKLLKNFSASVTGGTGALEATYDAPSPEEAERTLAAFTTSFTNQLEDKLGVNPDSIKVFNPPHADPEAVSPRPVTTLAFAGLLGLALGLLIAVFVEKSRGGRTRGTRNGSRPAPLVEVTAKETEATADPPARDAGAL